MAAKNVDIRINTTADTKGAKAAQSAMDALQKETEQAEHAFEEFNQTSAKGEQQLKETAAAAKTAAEVQAKAASHIAQQEKNVLALREKNNSAINTQTTSTSRLGQKAGAVGLQIQDVAVQAQAGTNAVTILAQQGSQIAGIFGPGGAIAGALLAIGAVAGKVFYDMAVASAVTGEAMEDMSEKLQEAFGKAATKSIEDFNNTLKQSTSFAQDLREAEISLTEAKNQGASANSQLIDSQLKLDEAAIAYLATTGQVLDKEKAIQAVRNQAAEATKNAQIEEAQQQVTQAQARYDAFVKQRDDIQHEVAQAEKRMAELEATRAGFVQQRDTSKGFDKIAVEFGRQKEGYKSVGTQAAEGELMRLDKQIENLYKIIEGAPARLEQHTNDSIIKLQDVYNVIETSEQQVSEITSKFDLTTKAQNLASATESLSNDAAAISKEIATIEAITPVQQEAKAAIQKAAADGVITAQEQVEIGRNLSVLLAGMKTGQTESINTVRQLIDLNNDMAIKMNAMNKEIDGLRQRVLAIPIR